MVCPALPCPALPCPALPCPALPCPVNVAPVSDMQQYVPWHCMQSCVLWLNSLLLPLRQMPSDTIAVLADKVFADSPGQCPAPNTTTAKSQPGGYCPTYVYDGQFCATSQPAWSAFREPAYGHGILTFENSTHALWQWNRNLDSENVNMDAAYVIRQLSCSNKASFALGAAPTTASNATATAG